MSFVVTESALVEVVDKICPQSQTEPSLVEASTVPNSEVASLPESCTPVASDQGQADDEACISEADEAEGASEPWRNLQTFSAFEPMDNAAAPFGLNTFNALDADDVQHLVPVLNTFDPFLATFDPFLDTFDPVLNISEPVITGTEPVANGAEPVAAGAMGEPHAMDPVVPPAASVPVVAALTATPAPEPPEVQAEAASADPRPARERTEKPENEWTTLVLRNIPNDYRREDLVALFNAHCFWTSYDLLYMPVDLKTRNGKGYAFLNLTTHEAALRFQAYFQGFYGWAVPTSKCLKIEWAKPHCQGLDYHIGELRNKALMRKSYPSECKPMLFRDGVHVPFPAPTKGVKDRRVCANERA